MVLHVHIRKQFRGGDIYDIQFRCTVISVLSLRSYIGQEEKMMGILLGALSSKS